MAEIPPLEYTNLESIPTIANGVRQAFLSHKSRPLEYRVQQLRKLYWGQVFLYPLLATLPILILLHIAQLER